VASIWGEEQRRVTDRSAWWLRRLLRELAAGL
jgi:hypothetical protein